MNTLKHDKISDVRRVGYGQASKHSFFTRLLRYFGDNRFLVAEHPTKV